MEEEPEFTSEELKSKLYQSFRDKGLIENLKSQLRSKLIVELRNSALSHEFPKSTIPLQEEDSLLHRASNSLVADHLRRCQYEYSLAVFLPESGVSSDKLFTTRDLLQLLKINPDSKLYRKIASSMPNYNAKGLLWQLLCEIADSHSGGSASKAVQADLYSHSSIVDKLDNVEREFRNRANGEDVRGSNVISEKMLSFQREVEARSKEQVNLEVIRFKEEEFRRFQLEERENYRLKLESSRKDLEKMYEMRCRALEERERNATERLQQQQQIVQKEMHAQRQNLLEELQLLRTKEADVRRESEVNKRAAKLEEDRRVAMEENLKLRETAVQNIEDTYKQRLKEQLTQYDLRKRKEYMDRLEDVERRERRVRDEARKLDEESQMNKEIKQQVREKERRIEEVQNLLQSTKNELTSANKSNEMLQEKVRDMVDYQQIKESNAVIRKELENTKMRLAETINEYKIELANKDERMQYLSAQASNPSHEVITLKAEMHRLKDRVKQEKALVNSKEAQLKSKLHNEADRNRELQRQLDEQTLQMKEMNRELLELRAELQETRTALSNEVYRKPNKPNNFTLNRDIPVHDTESGSQHTYRNLLTADNHLEEDYLPIRSISAGHEPLQDNLNQFTTASAWEASPSPDTLLAFLENTRERFRSLDREAENLEQSYKNFQHKMTNPSALRNSPNRADRDLFTPSLSHSPGGRNKQRKYGMISVLSHPQEQNSRNSYSAAGSHVIGGEHHLHHLRSDHFIPPISEILQSRSSANRGHVTQEVPSLGFDPPSVVVDHYNNTLQPQMMQNPSDTPQIPESSQTLETNGRTVGDSNLPTLSAFTNDGTGGFRNLNLGDDFRYIPKSEAYATGEIAGVQHKSPIVNDQGLELLPDNNQEVLPDSILTSLDGASNASSKDQIATGVIVPSLDRGWNALSKDQSEADVIVPSLDGAWKNSSNDQSAKQGAMTSLDESWKATSKDQTTTAQVKMPSMDGALTNLSNDQSANPGAMTSLNESWKATSKDQTFEKAKMPSLDGAWKTSSSDQPISLDSSWKESEQAAKEEEKRKQEEQEWEERRIQRMEERKKKENEARERERKMLEELQKQEASGHQSRSDEKNKISEESIDKKGKKDEGSTDERGKDNVTAEKEDVTINSTIDPIMQKYMKMVQEKQSQDKQKTPKQSVFDADASDYVEFADVRSIGGVSDTSDPFADW